MKNKILFIVLTTLATMTFQVHANEMEEPSLYDRLGGVYSITTSNGVINLAPDKSQVAKEIFRVLKPG